MTDTMTAEALEALFEASTITDDDVTAERATATPAPKGMQRQGDLLVIPSHVLGVKPSTGVITPLDGPVVALKGGTNEHVLSAAGAVTWAAAGTGGTDLGVLVVGPGGVATLSHTGHHGSLRVGPGEYVLRRQTAHSAPAAVTATPTVAQSWTPQDQPRPRPRRMVVD